MDIAPYIFTCINYQKVNILRTQRHCCLTGILSFKIDIECVSAKIDAMLLPLGNWALLGNTRTLESYSR